MDGVADGHGDGIGGIERAEFRGEAKKRADHEGDLFLFRAAVADNAAFDGSGRIFADSEAGFGEDEQNGAAHLAQFEGGAGIFRGKCILDGGAFRLEAGDDLSQMPADVEEAGGHGLFRVGANGPGFKQSVDDAVGLDDAEAGDLRTAVDAEDAHGEVRP